MDNANAASAVSPNPKQNNSLVQRVVSSAILLPIIIAIVWWSYWAMALVVAGVVVISLRELYGTYQRAGYTPRAWFGHAGALALLASAVIMPLALPFDTLPLVLAALVVFGLINELFHGQDDRAVANWALTLAGAVYVGWLFSYLMHLRAIDVPLRPGLLASLGMEQGASWVFSVMAITWLQDTFAYFVGKSFGKHKLAPRLSPKKTWEGAVGGLLGACVGAIAGIYIFCMPVSIPQALLLGLVGAVAGPLGDLSESLMKRQAGMKDASNLIPGHGGLLDRADSLLFTAPVLYYVILLIIR